MAICTYHTHTITSSTKIHGIAVSFVVRTSSPAVCIAHLNKTPGAENATLPGRELRTCRQPRQSLHLTNCTLRIFDGNILREERTVTESTESAASGMHAVCNAGQSIGHG